VKRTLYLIINSYSGEAKLRKSADPGWGELAIKLVVSFPEPPPIPQVVVELPAFDLPTPVVTQAAEYGLHWALGAGLLTTASVNAKGEMEFDLTEKGLDVVTQGASPDSSPYDLYYAFQGKYGLRGISMRHQGPAINERLQRLQEVEP